MIQGRTKALDKERQIIFYNNKMIKLFAMQGIYTSKAKSNYKRGNNLHWKNLLIKVKKYQL